MLHVLYSVCWPPVGPQDITHKSLKKFHMAHFGHFGSSTATGLKGLASVGCEMSSSLSFGSVLDVSAIMKLLHTDLPGVIVFDLYCPRAAPSAGVLSCTYHHCFQPYSKCRRNCQLPVSAVGMDGNACSGFNSSGCLRIHCLL